MSDIRKQPYSVWLEETLSELVELRPVSIGIVLLGEDGTTGTAYYNIGNRDRALMVRAMIQDSLIDFIRLNSDIISDILNGEEKEEEER